jgi:hypothetical protein
MNSNLRASNRQTEKAPADKQALQSSTAALLSPVVLNAATPQKQVHGQHLNHLKETAYRLGVSTCTLRRSLKKGQGPEYIKHPGSRRYFFTNEAINAYLEEHTRSPRSEGRGR